MVIAQDLYKLVTKHTDVKENVVRHDISVLSLMHSWHEIPTPFLVSFWENGRFRTFYVQETQEYRFIELVHVSEYSRFARGIIYNSQERIISKRRKFIIFLSSSD